MSRNYKFRNPENIIAISGCLKQVGNMKRLMSVNIGDHFYYRRKRQVQ